jgi:Tol biopolymer transport system component
VIFEAAEGMSWVDVQAPGQVHVIPNTALIADASSWSPDDRRLVIANHTSATRGLWSVGVDGTGLMKIAEITDQSGRPDWGYPAGPVVALP